MLTCSNPLQQFENVKSGTPVTMLFSVTNEGTQPVNMKAGVSCGCSLPILPQKTIAPNETIEMKVIFDSLGRSGRQEKNVWIDYASNNALEHGRLKMSFIVSVY